MKRNKSIILVIIILFILLLILIGAIYVINFLENSNDNNNFVTPEITVENTTKKFNRSVKEIIEDAGSKFIKRTDKVFPKIYVEFKYDLYDENGKSMKKYFYDLVDELAPVVGERFYLIDESKSIEIIVSYDSATGMYKVKINGLNDFYDKTDGKNYIDLANTEIVQKSDFAISNSMLINLSRKNMYYSNTEYADKSRVPMENDYYSYDDGAMYAKLLGGRVLNTILTKKYDHEIARKVSVGSNLAEIDEYYDGLAFGGVDEGYLCYRTDTYYIFLYNDQASIYEYKYKANEYFDEYLSNYCRTGDLEKLYEDFTKEWSSYFEKEYNPEIGKLKLTFPTRGIDIDIENNDSRGIKIYSNYYLTDTVKDLIKLNKITLEADKDLIQITEMARRESMR